MPSAHHTVTDFTAPPIIPSRQQIPSHTKCRTSHLVCHQDSWDSSIRHNFVILLILVHLGKKPVLRGEWLLEPSQSYVRLTTKARVAVARAPSCTVHTVEEQDQNTCVHMAPWYAVGVLSWRQLACPKSSLVEVHAGDTRLLRYTSVARNWYWICLRLSLRMWQWHVAPWFVLAYIRLHRLSDRAW